MIKILFICHGNICRSPMAQCIFQYLVDIHGLTDKFIIDSAATSTEEIGNPIYPSARRILMEHHIPLLDHHARQFRKDEYSNWDHILVMDLTNIRNISRLCEDSDHKIQLLHDRPIDDPWYTDDFETAYQQIYDGCVRLLNRLVQPSKKGEDHVV